MWQKLLACYKDTISQDIIIINLHQKYREAININVELKERLSLSMTNQT